MYKVFSFDLTKQVHPVIFLLQGGAEAQTLARFRGWAPLIALQIEYSLLERTVEGELIPMALELGLGVTPWGPLKSGVLSGKYTRDKHGQHDAGRGAWALSALILAVVVKLIGIL